MTMEKEQLADCIAASRISMLRLAMSITRRGADAEDAVSEAIVTAFEKRGDLHDVDRVKQWLMRITATKCYDLLRRRDRVQLTDSVADQPVFTEDTSRRVYDAISAMPPEQGQVLMLYYFDGYPTRAIANILHLTPTTVYMRLSRGRKHLRAALLAEGVTPT